MFKLNNWTFIRKRGQLHIRMYPVRVFNKVLFSLATKRITIPLKRCQSIKFKTGHNLYSSARHVERCGAPIGSVAGNYHASFVFPSRTLTSPAGCRCRASLHIFIVHDIEFSGYPVHPKAGWVCHIVQVVGRQVGTRWHVVPTKLKTKRKYDQNIDICQRALKEHYWFSN